MNLRDYAEGKECQVRIPGVCCGDPATTVLAHLRMAGITGGGQKAPDLLGAHACAKCHDEVDRRTRTVEREFAWTCFLEGMARTQYLLIREAHVRW